MNRVKVFAHVRQPRIPIASPIKWFKDRLARSKKNKQWLDGLENKELLK